MPRSDIDPRLPNPEILAKAAELLRAGRLVAFPTETVYGLGANAWTNDEAERDRLIADLAAGMVFINGNVTSYPQLPFGGVKNSGHGRELSYQGIREFCNVKSVLIGGRQCVCRCEKGENPRSQPGLRHSCGPRPSTLTG